MSPPLFQFGGRAINPNYYICQKLSIKGASGDLSETGPGLLKMNVSPLVPLIYKSFYNSSYKIVRFHQGRPQKSYKQFMLVHPCLLL